MSADQKIAVGVAWTLGFIGLLAGSLPLEAIAFALALALVLDITLGLTAKLR